MTLSDKLRQRQALQQRNTESFGCDKNSVAETAAVPAGENTVHPGRDDGNLKKALDRIGARERQRATNVPGESQQPKGEAFGGSVHTNVRGSFVHVDRVRPSDRGSTAREESVAELGSLLTGQTLDVDLRRVAFLDTETTGLSGGAGTYVFLVGVGSWCAKNFRVEQYFMRDYPEERAMLLALQERLEGVQLLVTFNGKSFDIPLLQSRFVLAKLKWPLANAAHLDLLHPARRLWKLRLGDCSLDNLEREILGIRREGDIPGHLIARLYFSYTRTGRPEGVEGILRHNRQDIETLADLATRVVCVLLTPFEQERPPEDLCSAGKYLEALGRLQLASVCVEAALESASAQETRQAALRTLARVRKFEKRYGEAADLWKALVDLSGELQESPCQELAIYYEHHLKDLEKALRWVEKVIPTIRNAGARAQWEKRRARLLKKTAKRGQARTTIYHSQKLPFCMPGSLA